MSVRCRFSARPGRRLTLRACFEKKDQWEASEGGAAPFFRCGSGARRQLVYEGGARMGDVGLFPPVRVATVVHTMLPLCCRRRWLKKHRAKSLDLLASATSGKVVATAATPSLPSDPPFSIQSPFSLASVRPRSLASSAKKTSPPPPCPPTPKRVFISTRSCVRASRPTWERPGLNRERPCPGPKTSWRPSGPGQG